MDTRDGKRRHDEVGFVGLRAQATAIGLLQLSIELTRAGVIDSAAIERVKDAIVKDLMLTIPNHVTRDDYEASVRRRLNMLFSGSE